MCIRVSFSYLRTVLLRRLSDDGLLFRKYCVSGVRSHIRYFVLARPSTAVLVHRMCINCKYIYSEATVAIDSMVSVRSAYGSEYTHLTWSQWHMDAVADEPNMVALCVNKTFGAHCAGYKFGMAIMTMREQRKWNEMVKSFANWNAHCVERQNKQNISIICGCGWLIHEFAVDAVRKIFWPHFWIMSYIHFYTI